MRNPTKLRTVWLLALVFLVPAAAVAGKESGFKEAIASVRAAASEIHLAQLQPDAAVKLNDSLDFLDSTQADDGWIIAGHDLPASSPAEKREYAARLRTSFQFVKNVANGFIRSKLDSARQVTLLKPLNDFETKELENALAERMDNLEMLEIKYGPNSAKLNVAEILVNHFLLRGIPAFGLDKEGKPGPLELVLSYTTSYLTPSWSRQDGTGVIITSAFEGGLRIYFLRHGWGKSALVPAYMTVGGLMAAKDQGVLRNPFETMPDFGGFLSWGAIKAGVVFAGDEPRFLLNRQFQFIPYLF